MMQIDIFIKNIDIFVINWEGPKQKNDRNKSK
jgi:hypothetical protein